MKPYTNEWCYVEGDRIYSNSAAFVTDCTGKAETYIRMDKNYSLILDGNTGKTYSGRLSLTYATRNKVHELDGVDPVSLVNPFLKNESSASEVETAIGAKAEYTDYRGVFRSFPVILEWDSEWVSQSGVNQIMLDVIDPSTNKKVYSTISTYLYVLNKPFIKGTDVIYIFEGEFLNPTTNFISAYGKTPIFAEKRIERQQIDVTFNSSLVDVWKTGIYQAYYSGSFYDYILKETDLKFAVTVVVQKRVGLTKEEQPKVDSRDFWLNVATIYHSMKSSQIIDITPENYKDGGSLRTEKVSSELDYDRQLNIEVGQHVYMSPNILNFLQTEKTGQLNVNLEGRT